MPRPTVRDFNVNEAGPGRESVPLERGTVKAARRLLTLMFSSEGILTNGAAEMDVRSERAVRRVVVDNNEGISCDCSGVWYIG